MAEQQGGEAVWEAGVKDGEMVELAAWEERVVAAREASAARVAAQGAWAAGRAASGV